MAFERKFVKTSRAKMKDGENIDSGRMRNRAPRFKAKWSAALGGEMERRDFEAEWSAAL